MMHARRNLRRVDVLVNNAGIYLEISGATVKDRISAFDARLEVVRAILETNLIGPFALSQGIIALMRDQGHGRVVSVTSAMGQLSDMGGGAPGFRLAAVGVNGMTKIFAEELRGHRRLGQFSRPRLGENPQPQCDTKHRRRRCYNGLGLPLFQKVDHPANSSATSNRSPGDPHAVDGRFAQIPVRSPTNRRTGQVDPLFCPSGSAL